MREVNVRYEELQRAKDALSQATITELKNYKTPPDTVTTVLQPTFALLQSKSSGWTDMKKSFVGEQFLNKLKDFDPDTVPARVLLKANEYVQQTPNFNARYMRSKSKACGEICGWVVAVVNSANISKEANTMREKIAELRDQQAKVKK